MLLWFVLKVIGLVLLFFVCLLFLLLCLILLVPIRYEAAGYKKSSERPEVVCHGDIYWLFHLIQLHAEITGKTKQADVRILWLHPFRPGKTEARPEEKQEMKSEAATLSDESNTRREAVTADETAEIEREAAERETETKSEAQTKIETETPACKTEVKNETAGDDTEKIRCAAASAEHAEEKSTSHKIKKIFLTFTDRIKKLREKESSLRTFIYDEKNQEAVRLLASRAKYLLRHMGFRRLKGELTVGFDDPAMMGRIMGIASLFYPLFSDAFRITPVFDHDVCEGSFELKGHIRLIHFVLVLLQLILNKRIRHFVFQHIGGLQ